MRDTVTLLQWVTALMPVLAVAVLLVALRLPATRAMPLALAVTVVLTLAVWKVPLPVVGASVVEGLVIGGGVLFIVVGAITLLEVMRASGGLDAIRAEFRHVSADSRVQTLLVAWFFVSFIEGAAGFGTPAPVAAPILMALGFPPLGAAVLALVGDSSAVTFGAVGTPIIVGIGDGLNLPPGTPETEQTLLSVALTAAGIDIVVGVAIPVALMLLVTLVFARERSPRAAREVLPLAVASALAYSLPAFGWTWLLGVEFGGILGGLTGMVLLVLAVRRGILVPRRTWTVSAGYLPESPGPRSDASDPLDGRSMPARLVWAPYLVLLGLLLLTRMVGPVQQALQSVTFEVSDVLGTGIGASFQPLYSPGAAFLVAAGVTVLIQGVDRGELRAALSRTGTAVLGTGIALAAAVPLVRVFLNSGENGAGLLSMPLELAAAGADALGPAWPLAAPVVGALGSFVSGSATFSHLMFAQLQSDVATSIGADPTVVLAQQVGGANGGNLVAAVNVVAVAGVTRQLGREGDIIVRTALPMAVYLLGFALVGTLLLALS